MPLPLSADDAAYLARLDQIRGQSPDTIDIGIAANIDALAATYPGISPGTLAALSQAGIGPGDQATAVWQKDLAANLQREPGSRGKAGSKKRAQSNISDIASSVPDKLGRQLLQAVNAGGIDPDQLNGLAARARAGKDITDETKKWIGDAHEYLGSGFNKANQDTLAGVALGGIGAVASTLPAFAQPGVNSLFGNQAQVADPLRLREVPGFSSVEQAAHTDLQAGSRGVAAAGMAGLEGVTAAARQNFGVQGLPLGIGPSSDTNPNAFGVGTPIQNTIEQTTLAQAISGKSLTDQGGGGYLPSWQSPAMLAQAEAARKYSPYLVGGHAWTLGRAAANFAFEPDSDAFRLSSGLIDAGVALSKVDPTAFGLSALSDARAEGKLFATADEIANAGAVSGIRKHFIPQAFDNWRQTRGSQIIERIAEETDPHTIHTATNLPYYIGSDPIVARLADATTTDEVSDILRPYVGTEIQSTFGYTPHIKTRFLTPVPARVLPTAPDGDMNLAAKVADDYLVNARVGLDDRKAVANIWARVGDSRTARYDAVRATFATVEKQLVSSGLDADAARSMMDFESHLIQEAVDYGRDSLGEPLINSALSISGDPTPVPHALWDNQFLNKNIELPDYREIRRQVSSFSAIVNREGFKAAVGVGDAIMSPWRKAMLMRPAWGARVVMEEQVRLAAYGMSSLTHNPMSWIGLAIGSPDSRVLNYIEQFETQHTAAGRAQQFLQDFRARGINADQLDTFDFETLQAIENQAEGAHAFSGRLRQAKAKFGRASMTPSGESFSTFPAYLESQYGNGITKPFSAVWDETNKVYLHEYTNVDTASEHGARALAEELARIHEARLGRGITSAVSPEDAKAAFWDGDLAPTREYMAEDPRFANLATSRGAADEQIDLLYKRLSAVTADNPKLVNAVATNTIDGVKLTDRWGQVTQEAEDKIAELIANGEAVPSKVRARKFLTLPASRQDALKARIGHTVDYMFDALMPRPSNFLSRSPFDRETTWKHAADLFGELDSSDRALMIQHAREANMGNKYISGLERADARISTLTSHEPRLDLASLNDLAMRRAARDTKALLYDLSERSQFADVARLIFPFAEAFKEVVGRWAKLAWENPTVIRRAEQAVMGARSPGSNAIIQATGGTPLGDGFFFKNQYGEESFAFPGSEILTDKLAGVPVPLTGSVSGLNMVGNGVPGIGPLIQLPLSYILPDKPQLDGVSRLLFPYGTPDRNPFVAGFDAFLPAYAKRLRTVLSSPDSTREYAGAVKDAASSLAATGDYALQGPDARAEMNRLLTDAKKGARNLYLIRAAGSFTLPASPSPEWLTTDKSGNLTAQWRVTDWFYKKVDKLGYDAAVSDYFAKFGIDNYLLLQPKTSPHVEGAQRMTSVAGSKWVRAHSDLATKYPTTYGLFAPDSGDFDPTAYQKQFANGERDALTPAEMLNLANDRLANFVYYQTKARLDGQLTDADPGTLSQLRAANAATLQNLRSDLRDEFPGFAPGAGSSTDPVNIINELYRASGDSVLKRTPAGRALNTYLRMRNQAFADQQAAGLTGESISTAKSMAENRAWLNEWGQHLAERTPSFRPIWDVLSREVT